jgi:hypothetical protein
VDPPDVPRAFHKYQVMEVNGLRSSAELIHFAIEHVIERSDLFLAVAMACFPKSVTP